MRIGELAELVGISTRAIRHYHRVGLLPVPARRTNGYREYSLRDAVELARVRRLVELGPSLGEVGDVLAGDAERDLAEILRELDTDLASQEADIRRRRIRLAQLLRQAEAGLPSEQAPVSPGLAGLFGRMAEAAAERPGPEPAMAEKDRDLMALLETVSTAHGADWLDLLTRELGADPGAVERAYAVYALLEELAGSAADDPRVEAAAQAIVAAVPEPARQAIQLPDGVFDGTDEGFRRGLLRGLRPGPGRRDPPRCRADEAVNLTRQSDRVHELDAAASQTDEAGAGELRTGASQPDKAVRQGPRTRRRSRSNRRGRGRQAPRRGQPA